MYSIFHKTQSVAVLLLTLTTLRKKKKKKKIQPPEGFWPSFWNLLLKFSDSVITCRFCRFFYGLQALITVYTFNQGNL